MALTKIQRKDYGLERPTSLDFPYAEYQARIRRARELMTENGVDYLVVWKRENVGYYFGYQTTHWEQVNIKNKSMISPSTLKMEDEEWR